MLSHLTDIIERFICREDNLTKSEVSAGARCKTERAKTVAFCFVFAGLECAGTETWGGQQSSSCLRSAEGEFTAGVRIPELVTS